MQNYLTEYLKNAVCEEMCVLTKREIESWVLIILYQWHGESEKCTIFHKVGLWANRLQNRCEFLALRRQSLV